MKARIWKFSWKWKEKSKTLAREALQVQGKLIMTDIWVDYNFYNRGIEDFWEKKTKVSGK